MRKLPFKKLILGATLTITIAAGVFLFSGIVYAEDRPQYVPDEIIVKFKAEAARTLEQQIIKEKRAQSEVSLAASLDKLNKKYKVKEFKQIFPNFKKNQKRLEALKKKDVSLLTKKEKHLLKRLKRGPKDAKTPALDRIYKLELEEGQSVEEAVAEYSQDPNVEYAQPNYIYILYETPLPSREDFPYLPNDYYIEDDSNSGYWKQGSWGQDYPDLWGLQKIQAIEAWNFFDTDGNGIIDGDEHLPGEGVVVAVIDTGVDYDHEDLHANIWQNDGEIPDNYLDDDENGYIDDIRGYDISDDDNDPGDDDGHGSHCAGTIAAMGDNTVGIAGVAYGAKIMPVKVFPNSTSANCAKGIRYAAFNGADVLSNSWGPDPIHGPQPSDLTVEAAIDDAYDEGCVIVFAAGNSNDDVANWSGANYPKTIAVAASDYNDNKAWFSCYGDLIDVAAPGVEILSLRAAGTDMYLGAWRYEPGERFVPAFDDNAKYYRANGTSMACPHVAGLSALILSRVPALTNEEVRQIIRDSADDLGDPGFDIYYGYGRINAYNPLLKLATPEGWILLDSNSYSAPAEVEIRVFDTDLNANIEICDTATVEIHSSTETVAESVVLTEIEPDKGIFKGTILLEAGASPLRGDEKLTVQHNDIITATYLEEDPPGAREATAVIDLQSPIINSVEVLLEITLSGETVTTITWHTDERSRSVVYYGTTPLLDSSAVIPCYSTDHIITMRGLELNTPYYFTIKSEDTVGNSTYDDNGGNLYKFTIIPPDIKVIPLRLLFVTLEGATTPVIDTFTISNVAGPESVDLLFEMPQPSATWLSISPDEGKISSTLPSIDVQVTVNPARLKAGSHTGEITINNNTPSEDPTIINVDVTALPAPAVHYKRYHIIDDWFGRGLIVNGDKRFNPGERVELQIEVENFGSMPAQDVTATLSFLETDPYVIILDDTIEFGDIPAGTSVLSLDNFLIEADAATPDYHRITFALDITDSEGHHWYKEFQTSVISMSSSGPAMSDLQLNTDEPGVAIPHYPQISCDNNGGVYVVWGDDRNGSKYSVYNHDIYFNYSNDYGITWQENDIRLNTNEPGASISMDPQISCDDNGGVYVVWRDSRNEEFDIYFNYSTDGGTTWEAKDIQLDTDNAGSGGSFFPQISCDNNGGVYVVWEDRRNGRRDIYFDYSTDHGATWQENDIRLDTDEPGTADSRASQISCDNNGGVYVVWRDRRNGWHDIYFNYSIDYGATWQENDIRLDTDEPGAESSWDPQISCDNNGGVYVVWEDRRHGWSVRDIYFNYSSDFGATWQAQDIRLDTHTPGTAHSACSQISCDDNGGVYVAWCNERNGKFDIYFNYSTDCGATWQTKDIRLDTDRPGAAGSFSPQISCDNSGHVYVVWCERRNGDDDIYFNYSCDRGATWQEDDIRLDTDEPGAENSWTPQISCDDNGGVYVVWEDCRNGNRDIYFIPIVLLGEISYKEYRIIDDWSGRSFMVNGDGKFNPGERIELQIEVENAGSMPAQDVTATLSFLEADPYVTILDDTIDLGNISAGEEVLAPDTFLVEADDTTPDYHKVIFTLHMTDSEGHCWSEEFQLDMMPVASSRTVANDISLSYGGQVQISCDDNGNIYVISRYSHSWGSDILFTRSPDYGFTWERTSLDGGYKCYTGNPQICCDNNGGIYAVWQKSGYYGQGSGIYFNYSSDHGVTWHDKIRLITSSTVYPKISCDNNGGVYVMWGDDRNGKKDIYFNYSTDHGATWQENDIRLDTDEPGTADSEEPQISCDNSGGVYVVWGDDRNGRRDIYFNYSTDHGATWQTNDIRLDTDEPGATYSANPQISCDDNGNIYVVWEDGRNGRKDIYFNYSTDHGATWQTSDIRLDTDEPGAAYSEFPKISCDNSGGVYIAWKDERNKFQPSMYQHDIYLNYSTDYGATWQTSDIRLDTDEPGSADSRNPQISCDDNGGVYVVWEDCRNTDNVFSGDIYLNYSKDFGATWQNRDIRLDTDEPGSADSEEPQISCDNNGNAYIVWEDCRHGVDVVYFNYCMDEKLNPIPDQKIAESETLEFTVTATNSKGTELELFPDYQGLPRNLQGNISTATFTTDFNGLTGETIGTFSWTPDAFSSSIYYPVVFVARDPTSGRCSYQAITITVLPPPPPVADFIATPAAGDVPLTVKFTDQSTGIITNWLWHFGDGGRSTEQNPAHTYKYVGRYSVSLKVTGLGGHDKEKKIDYINVIFNGKIYRAYSDKEVVMLGDVLNLYGEITGGAFTSYGWLCDGREFIRGYVPETQQGIVTISNSIHIFRYFWYVTPGTHTIQLRASNEKIGIDVYSKPFTITVAMDGKIIQYAIERASPEDTILLEPGLYILTSNLNIWKNITLKGAAGPHKTIIELGDYYIYIKDKRFYNQNEYYYQLFKYLNDVTIDGITIKGYRGSSREGAIQNYSDKLTLKNCKVIDNRGIKVGAIYNCWKSKLYLENTLIANNRNLPATSVLPYGFRQGATVYCGTIYMGGYSHIYVYNSTIANNINDSQSFIIQGRLDYDGTDGDVTINVRYGAIHRAYQNYMYIKNSIMWGNGNNAQDFSRKDHRQKDVEITYCDLESTDVYMAPEPKNPTKYYVPPLRVYENVIHEYPEFVDSQNYDYTPENPACADMGAYFE